MMNKARLQIALDVDEDDDEVHEAVSVMVQGTSQERDEEEAIVETKKEIETTDEAKEEVVD